LHKKLQWAAPTNIVGCGGPDNSVTPHLWIPLKPCVCKEHSQGCLLFHGTSEKGSVVAAAFGILTGIAAGPCSLVFLIELYRNGK
jgi:hypothetical protein